MVGFRLGVITAVAVTLGGCADGGSGNAGADWKNVGVAEGYEISYDAQSVQRSGDVATVRVKMHRPAGVSGKGNVAEEVIEAKEAFNCADRTTATLGIFSEGDTLRSNAKVTWAAPRSGAFVDLGLTLCRD